MAALEALPPMALPGDLPTVRVKGLAGGRLAIYDGARRTGLTVPIAAYLVAAGDDHLLFDCGLAARFAGAHELQRAPDEGPGPGSPYVPELVGPAVAGHLAELSVAPSRLVCSHLHLDHAGGAAELGLTVEAAAEEIERLRSPGAEGMGYPGADLAGVETRALDLDEGQPLGPFPASLPLAPYGMLVATPGHTPGSISLLARTASGPVLLCGDAAYPRLDQPESPAFAGMLRLRRAVESVPGLRLLAGHDTTALRAGWL